MPSLIRSVAIAAAANATHASTPHSASQLKTASHPCRSPNAASSENSRASAYGTTNPKRSAEAMSGTLPVPTRAHPHRPPEIRRAPAGASIALYSAV